SPCAAARTGFRSQHRLISEHLCGWSPSPAYQSAGRQTCLPKGRELEHSYNTGRLGDPVALTLRFPCRALAAPASSSSTGVWRWLQTPRENRRDLEDLSCVLSRPHNQPSEKLRGKSGVSSTRIVMSLGLCSGQ